jgi:hypothetical protein
MWEAAHAMAKRGMNPSDIADELVKATGLLRTYVVDYMRRHQSLWMTE